MKSAIINTLILGGMAVQGYGLFDSLGVGVAASVVGTELMVIGLVGAFRAG